MYFGSVRIEIGIVKKVVCDFLFLVVEELHPLTIRTDIQFVRTDGTKRLDR